MSRAAQRSFITQQGLSAAIRRVESSVGCQLLDRHPGGVRLTLHGREMYDALSAIVNSADLVSRLATVEPPTEATLVIGVTSPAAVGSISALHGAMPRTRIRIRQLNFDQLSRTLAHHLADVVITFGPLAVPGWTSVQLYSERLGILFPRSHRFAQEPSVSPDSVLGEVFLNGGSLPEDWPPVGRLDSYRRGSIARLGDPSLTDVRNPAEANEMVAARLALVTAPLSHARFFPHPLVNVVPLEGSTLCDVIALDGTTGEDPGKREAAETVLTLLKAMAQPPQPLTAMT